MSTMNPVTAVRLATLATTGFETESELAEAIVKFVTSIGQELIDDGLLSKKQALGVRRAINDTPLAFQMLVNLINILPNEEDRANLLFMLSKLADDMLSLGSLAVTTGSTNNIPISIINGARRGGRASGESRRKKSELEWRSDARIMAKKIQHMHAEYSQDKIATEIIALWKTDKPPGFASIKSLISSMISSGELRRPKRN